MTDRRLAIALWITFAFVTWNVAFDRGVSTSAMTFTREQIVRYHQGMRVASIDEAFHPHVRRAALVASGYAGLVLLSGAAVIWLAYPRHPHPRYPRTPRNPGV